MQDGEVDVLLARKKRRINSEYEVMLERTSTVREEITMLAKRCVLFGCMVAHPMLG